MASQKTKAELEEENGFLKTKLKEILEKMKTTESTNELPSKGLGIIKEEGKFKLVKLSYNHITKKAKVDEVSVASHLPEAAHMAEFEAKKYLSVIFTETVNSK